MNPKELVSNYKGARQKALELLWSDIEKALLQSPEVQLSLTKLQALNRTQDSSKGHIILDPEKLYELFDEEKESRPTVQKAGTPLQAFKKVSRQLRGYLFKSLQTNLKLIESSVQLSVENERLKRKLDVLNQKHKRTMENIEKILMNLTRNPN
ncbi:MAG: hypothetical protein ACE5E9_11145 [Nitrospinaceae bacterium]